MVRHEFRRDAIVGRGEENAAVTCSSIRCVHALPQATKIQKVVRRWQAKQRTIRRRELRTRLEQKQLTAMDCSNLLELLSSFADNKAQRELVARQVFGVCACVCVCVVCVCLRARP